MTVTDISPPGGTGAYGLALPTLPDALAALTRVHGAAAPELWEQLLAAAQLQGGEVDRDSVTRLLQAMAADPDSVTVLCSRALLIRLTSYDRLSAAHALVRNA